eukprot:scaffold104039_cov61-Phaeocystis_antarctica.AAC.1
MVAWEHVRLVVWQINRPPLLEAPPACRRQLALLCALRHCLLASLIELPTRLHRKRVPLRCANVDVVRTIVARAVSFHPAQPCGRSARGLRKGQLHQLHLRRICNSTGIDLQLN